MAVAESAYKSSISISNISKSVSSFGKGITQARSSTAQVNTILLKKTRFKRQAIAGDRTLFNKRREAVRRREQEDIIEASGVGGAVKRQSKVIASSTKGFLGRIMDFVGTLMIGWLINNLPLIIKMGEQVIQRIQKLVFTLRGFVSGITQILSGFGSLLGGVFSNLVTFNFANIGKSVTSSMDQMSYGFRLMENSIDDAFSVLQEPFDFEKPEIPQGGVLPVEGQPSTGEQPSTSGGGGGGGGGKWKPLLDLIASGEGGYTSIYPSDQNPNLTKMTIAEANRAVGVKGGKGAIGRYQFTSPIQQAKAAGLNPNTDLFSPANQDKMAVHIIENKRYGKDWLAGKITDEQFSEYLAREFGSFRSASGFVLPNNSGAIGFDKLKPVLKKVKATPAQTTSSRTPSAPTPTGASTSSTMLAKTAETLKQRRLDTSRYGRDGCVYAVNEVYKAAGMKPPWGTSVYVPTARDILVKKGWQQVGVKNARPGDIVIMSDTHPTEPWVHIGIVSTKGTVIHNSSTNRAFTNEDSFSTLSSRYVKIEVFRDPAAGASVSSTTSNPSRAIPAQVSTPPSEATQQMKSMTPQRIGPTVVVSQQQTPLPMIPSGGGGGGQSIPEVSSDGNELNRFMVQRLLLELAYT
jgi:hypothetical protein